MARVYTTFGAVMVNPTVATTQTSSIVLLLAASTDSSVVQGSVFRKTRNVMVWLIAGISRTKQTAVSVFKTMDSCVNFVT